MELDQFRIGIVRNRGPNGKFLPTTYAIPTTTTLSGQEALLPVANPRGIYPGYRKELAALRVQRRGVLMERARLRAARKAGQAVPRGAITQLSDQSRILLAQIRPYLNSRAFAKKRVKRSAGVKRQR